MNTVSLTPSPQARSLFNQMMRLTTDKKLSVSHSMQLAIERYRSELDPTAGNELQELLDEQWIDRANDGGWIIKL